MWRDALFSKQRVKNYDERSHDGRHIINREIAMRMLKRDYPLDDISDITSLTQEKLFELHERMRIGAQKA